jgi:hypothetical protein
MNALTRRLRRLEQRTFPPEDVEGLKIVVEIGERRRRDMEARGLPFEEDNDPAEDLRGWSLPEILKRRRIRDIRRLRGEAGDEPCGSPAKLSAAGSERC